MGPIARSRNVPELVVAKPYMRWLGTRKSWPMTNSTLGPEQKHGGDGPGELTALVHEAAEAPPNEIVVRVFQRLKAYGAAGITAIAPLLENDAKRPGIVIMIREIAKAGPAEQDAACSALIDAFGAVRPAGQDFLLQTITAIGCDVPDARFPPGTQFTPIGDAVTARHAVAAFLPVSKTRYGSFYLTECHWAFSTGWVDRHGGLSNSHGNRYCYFCARTIGSETAR